MQRLNFILAVSLISMTGCAERQKVVVPDPRCDTGCSEQECTVEGGGSVTTDCGPDYDCVDCARKT